VARSEDNAQVVRRIYESWNAIDLGLELFRPDFELHQTATMIDTARVFRGHDGLMRASTELYSDMHRLSWEPRDFVAAPGDRIVVPFRFCGVGRTSGIPTEMHLVHVWTLRDGLAVRCDTYEDLADALEAAGVGAA
jgi:ketosteroid isomerase-like protein